MGVLGGLRVLTPSKINAALFLKPQNAAECVKIELKPHDKKTSFCWVLSCKIPADEADTGEELKKLGLATEELFHPTHDEWVPVLITVVYQSSLFYNTESPI